MQQQIPILGPSSGNPIVQVNPQYTLNMYPKIEQAGSKSLISLYRTPGLTRVGSAGNEGKGRSEGVRWKGREYFIIGNQLISIDDFNAVTSEGTIDTVDGRCVIARGRDYLLIVDGENGYTFSGTTFSKITDSDFPANPSHAVYVDGYFLVNQGGTDNFYRSDFENPTVWQSLLFEVASASPDVIMGMEVFDRDIIVFGEDTTQSFYNTPVTGDLFNFTPYPNSHEMGLVAPFSIAKSQYGITCLAKTGEGGVAVVTITANNVTMESNEDDNHEIDSFDVQTDAIGSVHTIRGLTFYSLTFPNEGVTKVFNLGMQMSHHRKSKGIDYWRVVGTGYTGSRVLAVDSKSDNIFELNPDEFTENGDEIERRRITQIVHQDRRRFSCNSIEIEAQAGVGLLTGQGSDPKLQLAISRDGGKTYSGHRMKSMGTLGDYQRRTVWRMIGSDFRQLNLDILYTEKTEFTLIGGYANLEFDDVN